MDISFSLPSIVEIPYILFLNPFYRFVNILCLRQEVFKSNPGLFIPLSNYNFSFTNLINKPIHIPPFTPFKKNCATWIIYFCNLVLVNPSKIQTIYIPVSNLKLNSIALRSSRRGARLRDFFTSCYLPKEFSFILESYFGNIRGPEETQPLCHN